MESLFLIIYKEASIVFEWPRFEYFEDSSFDFIIEERFGDLGD